MVFFDWKDCCDNVVCENKGFDGGFFEGRDENRVYVFDCCWYGYFLVGFKIIIFVSSSVGSDVKDVSYVFDSFVKSIININIGDFDNFKLVIERFVEVCG